jgi:hypothetical protein
MDAARAPQGEGKTPCSARTSAFTTVGRSTGYLLDLRSSCWQALPSPLTERERPVIVEAG